MLTPYSCATTNRLSSSLCTSLFLFSSLLGTRATCSSSAGGTFTITSRSSWTLGAHRWVQAGHPRDNGARKGRSWCGPHETTSDTRPNDTDKRQDKRTYRETGVDCTGQVLTHTLGESYIVAELSSSKLLTTEMPQSLVEENVVNRVEVEKTRIIKIEQREMKPVTQEKINHETSSSRFRRIRTQIKLLM